MPPVAIGKQFSKPVIKIKIMQTIEGIVTQGKFIASIERVLLEVRTDSGKTVRSFLSVPQFENIFDLPHQYVGKLTAKDIILTVLEDGDELRDGSKYSLPLNEDGSINEELKLIESATILKNEEEALNEAIAEAMALQKAREAMAARARRRALLGGTSSKEEGEQKAESQEPKTETAVKTEEGD